MNINQKNLDLSENSLKKIVEDLRNTNKKYLAITESKKTLTEAQLNELWDSINSYDIILEGWLRNNAKYYTGKALNKLGLKKVGANTGKARWAFGDKGKEFIKQANAEYDKLTGKAASETINQVTSFLKSKSPEFPNQKNPTDFSNTLEYIANVYLKLKDNSSKGKISSKTANKIIGHLKKIVTYYLNTKLNPVYKGVKEQIENEPSLQLLDILLEAPNPNILKNKLAVDGQPLTKYSIINNLRNSALKNSRSASLNLLHNSLENVPDNKVKQKPIKKKKTPGPLNPIVNPIIDGPKPNPLDEPIVNPIDPIVNPGPIVNPVANNCWDNVDEFTVPQLRILQPMINKFYASWKGLEGLVNRINIQSILDELESGSGISKETKPEVGKEYTYINADGKKQEVKIISLDKHVVAGSDKKYLTPDDVDKDNLAPANVFVQFRNKDGKYDLNSPTMAVKTNQLELAENLNEKENSVKDLIGFKNAELFGIFENYKKLINASRGIAQLEDRLIKHPKPIIVWGLTEPINKYLITKGFKGRTSLNVYSLAIGEGVTQQDAKRLTSIFNSSDAKFNFYFQSLELLALAKGTKENQLGKRIPKLLKELWYSIASVFKMGMQIFGYMDDNCPTEPVPTPPIPPKPNPDPPNPIPPKPNPYPPKPVPPDENYTPEEEAEELIKKKYQVWGFKQQFGSKMGSRQPGIDPTRTQVSQEQYDKLVSDAANKIRIKREKNKQDYIKKKKEYDDFIKNNPKKKEKEKKQPESQLEENNMRNKTILSNSIKQMIKEELKTYDKVQFKSIKKNDKPAKVAKERLATEIEVDDKKTKFLEDITLFVKEYNHNKLSAEVLLEKLVELGKHVKAKKDVIEVNISNWKKRPTTNAYEVAQLFQDCGSGDYVEKVEDPEKAKKVKEATLPKANVKDTLSASEAAPNKPKGVKMMKAK